MKTYVIGDIHGAGEELQGLLDRISPTSDDKIILVGDCFDRGQHAHIVWKLILQHRMDVFMGNHEYKTMQWLLGKRDWLPTQYYVALNLLMAYGVAPNELLAWHQGLPLLRKYSTELDFVITHAAVNPESPYETSEKWNCFGNAQEMGEKKFWDLYQGSDLVIYGHEVTGDNLPRIRRNEAGKINSVGLDTAACHGGPLTCFCPEDFSFFSFRSGRDWGAEVRVAIKANPPIVNPELMAFVRSQREALKVEIPNTESAVL